MLARRELSEAQLRQRLIRRGHESPSIDSAISRLRNERYLDDARVAGAIARTETLVKGRGRLRVLRKIQAAGIAASVAEQAVSDVFQGVDAHELLLSALQRRRRGGRAVTDEREVARLYRYLTGQGFESDRVLEVLRGLRRSFP